MRRRKFVSSKRSNALFKAHSKIKGTNVRKLYRGGQRLV